MKIVLLAVAFSLGIGSAYADGGELAPNTQFTQLPGVIAEPSVHNAPPAATGQNGQAVHAAANDTRTLGLGPWLLRMFPLP